SACSGASGASAGADSRTDWGGSATGSPSGISLDLLNGELGDVNLLHHATEGCVELGKDFGADQVAGFGLFQVRDRFAGQDARSDVAQLIGAFLPLLFETAGIAGQGETGEKQPGPQAARHVHHDFAEGDFAFESLAFGDFVLTGFAFML